MDEKTIRKTLQKGERVTLECKRARNEVPKSVWGTYSAFANTIGGLILLGVDEDLKEKNPKKRYQILGVEDPQKIVTDFWNTINSDKVNQNILNDENVEIIEMEDVQIVCIHVPQADWRMKPIGVSYARNPKIQNMLRMVGYGENLGSGFPLILEAWKQAGWDTPVLNEKLELDEVELVLPVQRPTGETTRKSTLKSMQKSTLKNSQKNSGNTRESTQKSTLKSMQKSTLKSMQKSTQKSTQKTIIEIIMNYPNVTIPQVAQKLNLNPRGIAKHFKALQDKGLIQRVGPDKGGHWEIIEEK